MTVQILIVYDSRGGNTKRLAERVARGVEAVDDAAAVLRTVPRVSAETEAVADAIPVEGPPYAALEDLDRADGLVIGSPTHFGNMSASLKHFLDGTTRDWLRGTLAGKPAGVFTSTGSQHGGQETTLLTMMVPLLHHGMLICGLPYTHAGLMRTDAGGTPYGASHVSGESGDRALDDTEAALASALGSRVADTARRLGRARP